jgi:Tol biopolymer transport system component
MVARSPRSTGGRSPNRRLKHLAALCALLVLAGGCHEDLTAPLPTLRPDPRRSSVLTTSPTRTAADGAYDIRAQDQGTGTNATPYGINLSGDVVGSFSTSGGFAQRAVVWPGDGSPMRFLPTVPDHSTYSTAYGINDAGDAVGFASGDSWVRAVIWPANGAPRLLPLPPGLLYAVAYGVNAAGDVVGYGGGIGPVNALVWRAGTPALVLPVPSSASHARATSINASGEAAGWYIARGGRRAVSWSSQSVARDLHALVPGAATSWASGINTAGDVVGGFTSPDNRTHAVVWPASGGYREIAGLPASSGPVPTAEATSINDAGDIAGRSAGRAVVWPRGGVVRDLGTLGGRNGNVMAISGIAEVVGVSSDLANVYRPTCWSPSVANVVVTPATARLAPTAPDNTIQISGELLDAAGNPVRAERHVVSWSSDAPGVASVDASGLVTAVSPGTATISATSDGHTGTAAITVEAPVAAVYALAFTASTPSGANDIVVQSSDGSGRRNLTNSATDDAYPRWSPDGSRLYFQSSQPTGYADVFAMDASGAGYPGVHVTRSASIDAPGGFSPDGTKLLVWSDRPSDGGQGGNFDIWMHDADPASTTAPRRLTTAAVEDFMPTWSNARSAATPSCAAGGQVAWIRWEASGRNVWIMDPADPAGTERRLTSLGGFTAHPSWSPDCSRIVFSTTFDIYVVEVSSGALTRLTNDCGCNDWPEWSPDGRRIAWSRGGDIYLMNPDGTDVVRVTDTPDVLEIHPAFRSSGELPPIPPPALAPDVVFIASPIAGCCVNDIYLQRLDGTDRRRLTNQPTAGEFRPRWSPDGSTILFNRGGNLYSLDPSRPDGETLFLASADQGSYAPDVTRVVFTRGFRLWELVLATGVQTQLSFSAMDQGVPTYARDSRTIVFMGQNGAGQNIYVRDPDTRAERQLTFDGVSTYPSYSPDGSLILFQSGKNVYTMPAAGGSPTLVTRDPSVSGASLYPTWSSDSRTIVFSVQRSGQNEIYAIDADGQNPRPVTTTATDTETYPSVRPGP